MQGRRKQFFSGQANQQMNYLYIAIVKSTISMQASYVIVRGSGGMPLGKFRKLDSLRLAFKGYSHAILHDHSNANIDSWVNCSIIGWELFTACSYIYMHTS